MKQTKKWIALLISVLMFVSVLPTAFAANDEIIASGNGGEGITWTLTKDGVLTVSGNGPIVDDVEIEYDENGKEIGSSKHSSIAWQLNDAFDQRTVGLSFEQAQRARFDFVKTLIVAEGITEIPDEEFLDFYPRFVTLPSTLKFISYSAFDASFAESVTINSKDAFVNNAFYYAAYEKGAQPFASIEEAIDAKIAYEMAIDNVSNQVSIIYDCQAAYEILTGVNQEQTKQEFLSYFNETYGTGKRTLNACINYCLKKINKLFKTAYASADEIFTIVTDEDYSYVQRDETLDAAVQETYDSIGNPDARLSKLTFGLEDSNDLVPYQWLTVNAPADSTSEACAKASGLPFHATTASESDTFHGKVKLFFEQVKDFFDRIILKIKTLLFLIGAPIN